MKFVLQNSMIGHENQFLVLLLSDPLRQGLLHTKKWCSDQTKL